MRRQVTYHGNFLLLQVAAVVPPIAVDEYHDDFGTQPRRRGTLINELCMLWSGKSIKVREYELLTHAKLLVKKSKLFKVVAQY